MSLKWRIKILFQVIKNNTIIIVIQKNPWWVSCGQPVGNNESEFDGKPEHPVCLNKGFYLGKYEVTQAQWRKVMENDPSHFDNCGDNCPVEDVSWVGVREFIKKLNHLTGSNYRLHTESEWEYACRSGGKDQKYCGGTDIDDLSWNRENSDNKTHSVGTKQSNSLGLYVMSGNVSEWVQDWFQLHFYKVSPVDNPQGPSFGDTKVYRGGGYRSHSSFNSTMYRSGYFPSNTSDTIGFRLARSR